MRLDVPVTTPWYCVPADLTWANVDAGALYAARRATVRRRAVENRVPGFKGLFNRPPAYRVARSINREAPVPVEKIAPEGQMMEFWIGAKQFSGALDSRCKLPGLRRRRRQNSALDIAVGIEGVVNAQQYTILDRLHCFLRHRVQRPINVRTVRGLSPLYTMRSLCAFGAPRPIYRPASARMRTRAN
jgi:hypothetical protein